jgi:hypothetical protein
MEVGVIIDTAKIVTEPRLAEVHASGCIVQMRLNPLPFLLSLIALGGVGVIALSNTDKATVQEAATRAPVKAAAATVDAGMLNAYAHLTFDEIYVLPAGPKGLEFTEKTKGLNGGKVRMEGFMVKHYHDDPAIFLFTAVPAVHNQVEYMLADSLPTSLVHVIMDVRPGDAPVWKPQRITVMGTLETGAHQEIDGRVSHIRLRCEHVVDRRTSTLLELRKPLALQKDRMAYKAYQATTNSRLSGANPENTSNEPRHTQTR